MTYFLLEGRFLVRVDGKGRIEAWGARSRAWKPYGGTPNDIIDNGRQIDASAARKMTAGQEGGDDE